MSEFSNYLTYVFLLPIALFLTGNAAGQSLPQTTDGLIINYSSDYHEGLVRVDLAAADFSWSRNAYLNSDGKIAFWLPEGDTLYTDFSNGVAVIHDGGHCGYVNKTGAVIVDAQFDQCLSFSAERAPVKKGLFWGVIDKAGRFVIAPAFENIREFSEGYAAAETHHQINFMNLSGEKVINYALDVRLATTSLSLICSASLIPFADAAPVTAPTARANDFHEGLVRFAKGGLWGFMDRTGTVKVAPQFSASDDFSEGLAWVQRGNAEFFIFASGKTATGKQSPGFFVTHKFSQGLVSVKIDRGRGLKNISGVAVMNKAGNLVFKTAYAFIDSFHEGIAAIQSEDGKFGYLDINGNTILPTKFLRVGKFSEGFGAVQRGEEANLPVRYSFVDKNGRLSSK